MKTITLLLALLIACIGFSQTTIYQESFETNTNGTNYTTSIPEFTDGGNDYFTRTDGSNISSNVEISGIDGTFFFGAQDIDGEGATLPVSLTTAGVDVSGVNSVEFVVDLAEDADGSDTDWDPSDYVHFYYSLDGGAEQNLLWIEADIESGYNGAATEDTNFDGLGDGTVLTDVLTQFNKSIDVSSATSISIRVEFNLDAGDEDIAIDNIRLIDGFVTSPSVTISSPSDGNSFAPGTKNVNVSFITNDLGENDQIDITVNGTTTSNVSSPFTINTTDGTSYNVQVDVVSGGGSVDSDDISFSVADFTQVADITALRADVAANGLGRYYEITGDVTFTHADGYNNRKWFQDASPSGIYVEDGDDVIPNDAYSEGDLVKGLKGVTSNSNGVLTFEPVENTATISGSTDLSPLVLTLSEFNSNFEDYESVLVGFEDVSFTDADGAATFSTGSNYEFSDGNNDTSDIRTQFYGADYIGNVIPTGNLEGLVGLAAEYNGSTQIFSRSLSDINTTLSTNTFDSTKLKLYPNPVSNGVLSIETQSSATAEVEFFNMLGQKVLAAKASKHINVSSLSAGIYLVRVQEGASSQTKKIVIK